MNSQFQVGRTYATRSICDHECIFSFVVLSRTAKTVTVNVHGKTVRRGLTLWNGVEQFSPFGRYSMAPIVGADDLVMTTDADLDEAFHTLTGTEPTAEDLEAMAVEAADKAARRAAR